MRFFSHVLTAFSLSLFTLSVSASNADPKNDTDYLTLATPQATESGKKVEVIEFFGYFCPHCNVFDPVLTEWVKKQGDAISFKRVPVAYSEPAITQQKLFYALESMGKGEELHKKIFNTIHVERQPLNKDEWIADFVAKQGIDKQKFLDVYNSFTVQSKVRRAGQLATNYKIEGVPTIAIGGRYLTSPSIAAKGMPAEGQSEAALQAGALTVMDFLVAKVAKENAPAAPEPKAGAPKKAKAAKEKK